jgi:hypothetical protein
MDSFNYAQPLNAGIPMRRSPVPRWELRYIREHPGDPDDVT